MRESADQNLDRKEAERVLARMRSKLMRRLEEKKISPQEAIAIQLQIETEELHEWRARMTEIRTRAEHS
ncbi:MAG TPA: hypothetical protein PKC12_04970 [Thiobacillaceae bacterium]|nr:hypothetical protein [Thiobacillaceae bacterium]